MKIISIVDDDPFVREAIRDLIQSLGYEAAIFDSAERFLESMPFDETSCLITDLHMPGIGGLELQKRLIAAGHRIPIMFVTAFPEDRFRERAMLAGAIGFLTKPFDEAALIRCLETALASTDHVNTTIS
jgi:FixJ family two-component response regulator